MRIIRQEGGLLTISALPWEWYGLQTGDIFQDVRGTLYEIVLVDRLNSQIGVMRADRGGVTYRGWSSDAGA